MSETKPRPCTCKHEFQDKRYQGKRLHNATKADSKGVVKWRCTVCGSLKE